MTRCESARSRRKGTTSEARRVRRSPLRSGEGVNAPTDFDLPDNLALDQHGNLYITEDPGGGAPSKTLGDDVWFAPFNPDSPAQSLPIRRFFSITDCQAEPTGLYVSPSGKTLFVNIQHRGGSDPRDLTIAVSRMKDISFNRASQ